MRGSAVGEETQEHSLESLCHWSSEGFSIVTVICLEFDLCRDPSTALRKRRFAPVGMTLAEARRDDTIREGWKWPI